MSFILGVLLGIAIGAIIATYRKKDPEMLEYHCPRIDCGAHFECNDPTMVMKLAQIHDEYHNDNN